MSWVTGQHGQTIALPQKLQFALAWKQDKCLIWPHGRFKAGYGAVWDGSQNVCCHVLVCEAVNGPKPTPKHEAAHSCGQGHAGCIAPLHLSWKTPAENEADKLLHGTSNRGERQGSSKLNRADVVAIRASTETQNILGARYGVSRQHIGKIQQGDRWGWL